MASSARKNLCAALKIDCFAPKPVPEKEEAPDLEAGGDEELDYKQETTTPVAEPRPPAVPLPAVAPMLVVALRDLARRPVSKTHLTLPTKLLV